MIRRILWLVVALLPLCQSGCCWCHPLGSHHCCCSPAGNGAGTCRACHQAYPVRRVESSCFGPEHLGTERGTWGRQLNI